MSGHFRRFALGLINVALAATGCAGGPKPAIVPSVNSIVWNQNIASASGAWLKEARTRFGPNCFVFAAHGNTTDGKTWRLSRDGKATEANIEAVGDLLHRLMPDRDVVLVSCNAGGVRPKLPRRVWYAPAGLVWMTPGRALRMDPDGHWEWGAGSIQDFIEGTGTK